MLKVKTIEIFCAKFALKKEFNKLAAIPVTTKDWSIHARSEENKVLIILKTLKTLIHAQRLENIINIHTYIFIARPHRAFQSQCYSCNNIKHRELKHEK